MMFYPYDHVCEVSDIFEFVKYFKVKKLFKKLFKIDLDKWDQDRIKQYNNNDICDSDAIEILLKHMDGVWRYRYDYNHGNDCFHIYKLNEKELKNMLLEIFPKENFTKKFIAEIIAEKV